MRPEIKSLVAFQMITTCMTILGAMEYCRITVYRRDIAHGHTQISAEARNLKIETWRFQSMINTYQVNKDNFQTWDEIND